MLHLITCHGRIMPRLAERLLLVEIYYQCIPSVLKTGILANNVDPDKMP